MRLFRFNNDSKSEPSTSSDWLETSLEAKKQLLIRPDFIEFQDWLSDTDTDVLSDKDWWRELLDKNDLSLDEIFADQCSTEQ